jgi:hypothetical protein
MVARGAPAQQGGARACAARPPRGVLAAKSALPPPRNADDSSRSLRGVPLRARRAAAGRRRGTLLACASGGGAPLPAVRDLFEGAEGSDVRGLQLFLEAEGYLEPEQADGCAPLFRRGALVRGGGAVPAVARAPARRHWHAAPLGAAARCPPPRAPCAPRAPLRAPGARQRPCARAAARS